MSTSFVRRSRVKPGLTAGRLETQVAATHWYEEAIKNEVKISEFVLPRLTPRVVIPGLTRDLMINALHTIIRNFFRDLKIYLFQKNNVSNRPL
jgi:hypothetical protein